MVNNKRYGFKTLCIIVSMLLIFITVGEVRVSAAISSNANLASIQVNGQRIDVINTWITNYNLELPANTPEALLSVVGEPYDLNSIVSIEGNILINKCALVKIIVTAEDKVSKKIYYVNVTLKEANLNGSFIDIKTADFHSIALKSDGTLYSFGENDFGQLGDGTKVTSSRPVQVKGLTNVIDFDTSNSHGAAATADGSVWVWGLNDYGQLDGSTRSDVLTPIKVNGLYDIVKVRVGNRYNLALDRNGSVWFWGYNSKGQLEDEVEDAVMSPTMFKELKGIEIQDIETGDFHSLALSTEGKVYSWGANDYGQLGDGSLANRYTPIEVPDLSGIRYINAKGNTSSCITGNGLALFWGESSYPISRNVTVPEEVQGISSPLSIEANNNNTVELSKDGYVHSLGINKYGQLGNGSYVDRSYYSSISGTPKVKKISTSPFNIFMIGVDGYIYSLGRNEVGQLGTSSSSLTSSTVQKISEINNTQIERVYADRSSGEVSTNTVIKLATGTLDSKIYYTLDGSDPTDMSIPYVQPITITKYTVIKAIAVRYGKYSAVSTFQYIVGSTAITDINVTIGSKSATSGGIIEIPITFSNIPETGIDELRFAIQFNPEVLQLSTVTPGELIKESKDFSYSISNGTVTFSFNDSTKTGNNIIKSGTFAVIKLYVRSSLSLGKYSISQVFTSGEGFFYKTYSKYNVKYNAGYIDTDILYGDVDGDLQVTALDLQYVQRYVANKLYYFPGSRGREAADMDKDGAITSNDVELVKKRILRGE
jgi:alpha-tubulin suppressor-like RCC1 family protein